MEECRHPHRGGQVVAGYDRDGGWVIHCSDCRHAWALAGGYLGPVRLVDGWLTLVPDAERPPPSD